MFWWIIVMIAAFFLLVGIWFYYKNKDIDFPVKMIDAEFLSDFFSYIDMIVVWMMGAFLIIGIIIGKFVL